MRFKANIKPCGPFDGKPKTVALYGPNGELVGYLIEASYLTPDAAKSEKGTPFCLTLAMASASTALAGCIPPQALDALDHAISASQTLAGVVSIVALVLPFLVYYFAKKLVRKILSKTAIIQITRDELRIKDRRGWKVWSRHLPHRFALLEHDKALQEWIAEDLKVQKAAQRGKIIQPKRWYQDSRHVVFEVIHQRVDIAEVYDVKETRALQARLTGCAQVIDAMNGGVGTLQPQDEWAAGPGDLPND